MEANDIKVAAFEKETTFLKQKLAQSESKTQRWETATQQKSERQKSSKTSDE